MAAPATAKKLDADVKQIVTRQAEFPIKLQPFWQPMRYKVAHGGRGGAKSWAFARMLLILGRRKKLRILCCREIYNSIEDSSYQLLLDQAERLGFYDPEDPGNSFYKKTRTHIVGRNGTVFMFAGLWMNVDSIKSKESIDVCWVEEAHNVSKDSWQKLIPSIRKDPPAGPFDNGSEIWVSFNPELETDDTYTRFVVNPPKSAVVIPINWRDNPWFPQVLMDDMQADRERNYDDYLHVWEGQPKQFLEGAIYADELRAARTEGRITKVVYDRRAPVHAIWDLGWRDLTSIWFAQKIGPYYNLISFWQGRRYTIERIFAEVIQPKAYMMGNHFLPHDADHGHLASGGVSVKDLVDKAVGDPARVKIVANIGIDEGINAARTLFPQTYFDEAECADGLQALRHYRFDIHEKTGLFSRVPLHDHNSHGADAFRYFAVSVNNLDATEAPPLKLVLPTGNWSGPNAWMRR